MSDPAQSAEVAVENTTAPAAAAPQGEAGAAPPQGGPRGPRGPRAHTGGAPGGFGSPAGGIMGRNLYIKNLDESVGDKELKEAFEKFGEITSAKIMMDDKSPPQSRGFGFVCFKELASATRAIAEMNGHVLGSKPLYVNVAQRKEQRQQAMATHFNQHGPVGGMPGVPAYQGYPPFAGNQFGFGFGFPAPGPRGGMPQGGARGWPMQGMPGMPVQMPMQWGPGPAPGPRGAPPRGA